MEKDKEGKAGARMAQVSNFVATGGETKNLDLNGLKDINTINSEYQKNMSDAGLGKVQARLKEKAEQFFKKFANDVDEMKQSGDILTQFQKSLLDISSASERFAIMLLAESSGMVQSGDNGKLLEKLIPTIAKMERDIESANDELVSETKKAAEALRSRRIKEKTMLGAGLLQQQLTKDNLVEQQPEIINKKLQGEAATQSVVNKINKDRINILLKSKNFEMKILAELESELTKSAESDILALKQSQIKNQIFSSNQNILISSIAKVLAEQEGVAISNKDKEVKLAIFSNSEKIKSFSEDTIKAEILDAEINAKTTEGRRKILENVGYSRMLAEAQVKTELELAKISAINAEQKLAAQVANGSISELVNEELRSKLSSTRTEALKASESAIQLQLNKEQTKEMQKANELLELSNKFTAMKNAEMLASKGSDIIRMDNQMQRQTDQLNMIAGAKSAVDMAAMTGNADDKAVAANQISDVERSITGKSGALTALAQKMAEVEVAASSLSADLASTMFDGVRSGFGTLLTDIATGAETAGGAWEKFGLGVAKQLLDRVMQNNIDKMMSNLTFAFTGVKNDPQGQQKLLASATTKQTNATNSLTQKIEELRRSMGGDIAQESGGESRGPLASIDSNDINKLVSKMGTNAGGAAEGLKELQNNSLNLANFFTGEFKDKLAKINGEKAELGKVSASKRGSEKKIQNAIKEIEIQNSALTAAKSVTSTAKEKSCLLYTSPSPRDAHESRMPSSA